MYLSLPRSHTISTKLTFARYSIYTPTCCAKTRSECYIFTRSTSVTIRYFEMCDISRFLTIVRQVLKKYIQYTTPQNHHALQYYNIMYYLVYVFTLHTRMHNTHPVLTLTHSFFAPWIHILYFYIIALPFLYDYG